MTDSRILHETIVIERVFGAKADRVFSALADPVERMKWGVPSDTAALIYDESDFSVGGRDVFRCGAKSDPKYRGETRYLQIVPGRCIVSSETIDDGDKRLSASLTTVELFPDGARTKLVLTVQVASFCGRDMIEGTKFGHNGALANLGKLLA